MASYDDKMIDGKGLYYFLNKIKTLLNLKQDKLTAGDNITIENNVISATDTTYTAGAGINITGTTISTSGTSGDIYNVVMTKSGSDYIADHTASDIYSAATSGKVVTLDYSVKSGSFTTHNYYRLDGTAYNSNTDTYSIGFTNMTGYKSSGTEHIAYQHFSCTIVSGTNVNYTLTVYDVS